MNQPIYLMAHDLNIPAESALAGWQSGYNGSASHGHDLGTEANVGNG